MNFLKSINLITIIPILISMFSLLISIITALRSWWVERFSLNFDMIKWFGGSPKEYPFHIWISVTNSSKLPCSVLEVKIENTRSDKIIHGSGYGERKLILTRSSTNKDPNEIYSFSYPVNIAPYSSIGGYFHIFSNYPFYFFEDDTVKITIRTNTGSVTKDIFMDYGKNIFRVLQSKSDKDKILKHSDGSTINYLNDTI
ncbi:hypothetical protein FC961_10730 [Clostridium botulinum]|nr:hypothetical protein [Clostridium botulinum]NFO92182.1 hypothetical protein [Clostridium botulinum]